MDELIKIAKEIMEDVHKILIEIIKEFGEIEIDITKIENKENKEWKKGLILR